jgi:hypothetical protein
LLLASGTIASGESADGRECIETYRRPLWLLSFIAISGFAVVAAVVGSYAFYAIGEALHRVTDKSVRPISPVPFPCCNQRSCKPTLAWS